MSEPYSVEGTSYIHAFGFGPWQDHAGFVEISYGDATIKLTPEAARRLAEIINREADKAEKENN